MKYMGSKNYLLKNGLGELIIEQAQRSERFFDPFCGSAVVSWFTAINTSNKVIAGDLQSYSMYLANAVLLRTTPLIDQGPLQEWIDIVKSKHLKNPIPIKAESQFDYVTKSRIYCNKKRKVISKSYGGYYFSPDQAQIFDYLLESIPSKEPYKSIAKAALISVAAKCAASPGHTAQPFQPTKTAIKFIMEAWARDPFIYIKRVISELSKFHSKIQGKSYVINAYDLISKVKDGDLIFIDPPYSGVHYSRFYHVLETIARGYCSEVSGRGRYPVPEERPVSEFSRKSESLKAFDSLLNKISKKKASAIVTFPSGICSNGLSGEMVKEIAKKHFKVKKNIIKGKFSTLGGNKENRPARLQSSELILLLTPK